MDELIFPLAALALTFLLLMPALTLLSRAALARRRARTRAWATFGDDTTFAWLVAPTLLPLLWLASSALHQSEPSSALRSCLVDHPVATTCLDAAILLGGLLLGVAAVALLRAWRERPRFTLRLLPSEHPLTRRVQAISALDPRLCAIPIDVAQEAPAPAFSLGWLRPRAVLDACFVQDADDAMLRAALLHERAHITARDTLRAFIASAALALNPAGRWLAADLLRWRQAREALCDSEAVQLGGDPLALAEGIVRAARFQCAGATRCGIAPLCGDEPSTLRLRLAILLRGSIHHPRRTLGHLALITALLAGVILPHFDDAAALDRFHVAVEQLLHTLL